MNSSIVELKSLTLSTTSVRQTNDGRAWNFSIDNRAATEYGSEEWTADTVVATPNKKIIGISFECSL